MEPRILPLVRSFRKSTRTHWLASSNFWTSPKEEPWDNNWTTTLSSRRNNSPYTHNILYHREKPFLALAKPLGSSDSTPWFSFTVPGSSSLLCRHTWFTLNHCVRVKGSRHRCGGSLLRQRIDLKPARSVHRIQWLLDHHRFLHYASPLRRHEALGYLHHLHITWGRGIRQRLSG